MGELTGGLGMKNILALSFLVLLLAGCSNDSVFQGMADDSGRDARKADAAIALDNRQYDEVIDSLAELYNTNALDPQVSRLLGSAYMGKAGIDATGFIGYESDSEDDIFDIVRSSLLLNPSPWVPDNDQTSQLTCNVDDLTVLMTSSGGDYIDGHCIDSIIEYLDKAKRIFYVLQHKNMATPSDRIQYSILSAVHFGMLIGNDTARALSPSLNFSDPTQGSVPVPINKSAYYLLRNGQIWSRSYSGSWHIISGNEHTFFRTPLSYYQEDLMIMLDSLDAYEDMGIENDFVKDDIESLLLNILQNPSGDIEDAINTMTTAGITGYIQNVLSVE